MPDASCLCGAVSWNIEGPFAWMTHCHCSRCRKSHGAAFATWAAAPVSGFHLDGSEHVVRFPSSPEFPRCFCDRCGAVVPGDPYGDHMFVPAGNFLDDPGTRPVGHIFVGSKAPWFDITDALPQFAAYPDGFDAPVLPDRAARDAEPGTAHGSCLCGAVAYVLTSPALRARHCHCGRCRRARSAAHASNLLAVADAVRFSRGADALTTYRLPDTRFFAQTFCRSCGSPMPRIDASRNLAVVPMGGLDGDPVIRPAEHIFVGSKAPWYDITDALPQYAEQAP
jgi:hypothetical protein